MITYSDIEGLYQSLKYTKASAFIYALVVFIIFIIASIKLAIAQNKEAKEGYSYKSLINIIQPVGIALIGFAVFPVISSFIEIVIREVFNLVGSFSAIDDGGADLIKYRNEVLEDYDLQLLEHTDDWTDLSTRYLETAMALELWFLDIVSEINRYLFTFAITTYFAWLLMIEIFSPLGGVGFIYKEFKNFSESWIKNYFSCHAFLASIIIANALSLGVYKLYREFGDYNLIVHIICLLILRGYLYKQSLTISKSII